MNDFLRGLGAGLVPVAIFALIVLLPPLIRSRFRYRLWELRDHVVDDVLIRAHLTNTAAVRALVDDVEGTIRFADTYLLERLLLFRLVCRPNVRVDEPTAVEVALTALSGREAKMLRGYYEQLRMERIKFLLLGSPLGWMAVLVVGIYAMVRLIMTRSRRAIRDTGGRIDRWMGGGRGPAAGAESGPLASHI